MDATIILRTFGSQSVPALTAALNDPDAKVRKNAQRILNGIQR
jgi:HEAT repeat protein